MNAPLFRIPDLRPLLRDMGIDAATVLQRAGLPLSIWSGGTATVGTEQMFALWQALEATSDDPMTGINLARGIPLESHHPACIAAQHSRTFRDALQRFARYKLLCCDEEMSMEEEDGECRIGLVWMRSLQPPPALLVDAAFSSTLEMGRNGTKQPMHAVRVELRRSVKDPAPFEEFFGCRVRFRAEQDSIVFRSSDLDRLFITYNAELLEMLSPPLDRALEKRRARPGIAEQVKWVVKRLIGASQPQIGDVAKELAMSGRTLQRRIAEEGSSFRQLLIDARRELARHYLKEPSLTLTETACLLGFEDPNSFFRAFRGWEGISPGEWRRSGLPGQ